MPNIEQGTLNSEGRVKGSSLRNSLFSIRCSAVLLAVLTSGCTKMITTPIKAAGKVATTSIDVAGVKAGTKVAKSAGGDSTAVQAAALLAK
jgi:hypothetical protein